MRHSTPQGDTTPPQSDSTDADISGSHTTGVRPRNSSPDPIIVDAPEPQQETAAGRASIPPESLRKPYASLAPPAKKRDTATGPRPSGSPAFNAIDSNPARAPMPSWDDSSSLSRASLRAGRAVCQKHKIALRNDGVCMLCRKEHLENTDTSRGWKLMVLAVVVAIIGGGIVAALI